MPTLESIVDNDGEVLGLVGGSYVGVSRTSIVEGAAQTINPQTGTTYTLVVGDANRIVTLTNAAGITLTVPSNTTAAIPVGSTIRIIQSGAGQVTAAAAVGVTLNVAATFTLKLLEQNAEATLTKLATNTWLLTGVLEAV
jgi:hypothetical protein